VSSQSEATSVHPSSPTSLCLLGLVSSSIYSTVQPLCVLARRAGVYKFNLRAGFGKPTTGSTLSLAFQMRVMALPSPKIRVNEELHEMTSTCNISKLFPIALLRIIGDFDLLPLVPCRFLRVAHRVRWLDISLRNVISGWSHPCWRVLCWCQLPVLIFKLMS